MLISNNHPSFHLWRKENLVKDQKVSKYYETHCWYTYFRTLEVIEAGLVSWVGHNKQNVANKLLLNIFN